MGMDVFGKDPTAPEGEYFRRNVWGWRPLARLCQVVAPDITVACEHWDTNDGDGLGPEGAIELAKRLDRFVADGDAAIYIQQRNEWLAQLPDERCGCCEGTGVRCNASENVEDECRACDGKGKQPNWERHYPLDEDDVKEWVVFLKACGGFSIC